MDFLPRHGWTCLMIWERRIGKAIDIVFIMSPRKKSGDHLSKFHEFFPRLDLTIPPAESLDIMFMLFIFRMHSNL